MKIETVTIGSEILEGQKSDTSAIFLSSELSRMGYSLQRHTVLPNHPDKLQQGLKEALSRSTLVIVVGGIGRAFNDVTKGVAVRLFSSALHVDPHLYDALKNRIKDPTSLNEQSKVPKDAILLPNPVGISPGFLFLSTEGSLLALPGDLLEMQKMFREHVVRLLTEHFPISAKTESIQLHFCQLNTEAFDPLLREIHAAHPDAQIHIDPMQGSLCISISVSKDFGRLRRWMDQIRGTFPTHFFEAPTLLEAVHQALITSHQKLAIAESCTGGALAAHIVSMPGSSHYLLGALVVYSSEWKEHFLHVSHETLVQSGPVSLNTVHEMCAGIFHESRADYAIAISGIAGPSGGTPITPVGTVFIAVAGRDGWVDAGRIMAPPDRLSAIEFSVQYALSILWRRLAYQVATFT